MFAGEKQFKHCECAFTKNFGPNLLRNLQVFQIGGDSISSEICYLLAATFSDFSHFSQLKSLTISMGRYF